MPTGLPELVGPLSVLTSDDASELVVLGRWVEHGTRDHLVRQGASDRCVHVLSRVRSR